MAEITIMLCPYAIADRFPAQQADDCHMGLHACKCAHCNCHAQYCGKGAYPVVAQADGHLTTFGTGKSQTGSRYPK